MRAIMRLDGAKTDNMSAHTKLSIRTENPWRKRRITHRVQS
jgi:hypothetical protein